MNKTMNNTEIKELLKQFIEKTSHKVKDILVTENDSSSTWFSIEMEDPRMFLEREGEGVFALNYVIRKIIESKNIKEEKNEKGLGVIIDINDFQKRRVEGVRSIAHMMAERARYFKSNIEIDPMPAFERRIIHEFLSSAEDLKTESEGVGRLRRVVIKYIGEI